MHVSARSTGSSSGSAEAPARSASYSASTPTAAAHGQPVHRVLGSMQQHLGAAVGENVGELRRCQPPVERYEHGAELAGGEQGLQERGVVGPQVRDSVPVAHAQAG